MDEPTLQQVDLQQAREASLDRVQPPELPGYRLERLLGQGSFGQVWSGQQLSTGQEVAIKILHCLEAAHDLEREVERLRQVSQHPHVVSLLDANVHHRPPFLVLPLLQGSLGRQEQSRPSVDRVVAWLQQAAGALQYVHARGLLHCDLKPANLLLDSNSGLRVADFGQALLQQGDEEQRLGTLFYMPPEQARWDSPTLPSISWDIYALGATFYHLLADQPPRRHPAFQEQLSACSSSRETLQLYALKLPQQPLQPLAVLRPDVDADLVAILEHCLELQPERRYADMGALLDDLQRRKEYRPLRCRGSSPAYIASRFVRRHRGAVAVAVLALLLLSGAMAQVVQQRSEAIRQARLARQQSSRLAYLLAVQSEGSQSLAHLVESLHHDPSPDFRAVALNLYLQLLPRNLGRLSFRGDWNDLELADLPDQGTVDLENGQLLAASINGNRLARVDWRQRQAHWLESSEEFHQGQLAAGQVAILDGEEVRWSAQDVGDLEADWIRQCPLGKTLVVAEDDDGQQNLRFLGAASGELSLPGSPPSFCQFSEDGAYLALLQSGDRAHLLGLHPPRRIWSGNAQKLTFAPGQPQLLAAHRDQLWAVDGRSGRAVQEWSYSGWPLSLAANAESVLVGTSDEQGGRLHQFARGSSQPVETLSLPAHPLALWVDSKMIAVGCSDGSLRTFGGRLGVPGGVLFCSDQIRWLGRSGQELLAFTSSHDSTEGDLWRWQLPEWEGMAIAGSGEVQLSERGVLIFDDQQVEWRPWSDLKASWVSPHCIRQPQLCGSELVAVSGKRLLRLSLADGRTLGQADLPKGFQLLRPDGKAALVCNLDGSGWKEVSLADGRLLRQHPNALQQLERPVYSQDGRTVTAREGEEVVLLFSKPPRQLNLPARDLWLSASGERLWVTTGEGGFFTQLATHLADPDAVTYFANSDLVVWVASSPDQKLVATVGGDGKACLWPAQPPAGGQVQPLKTMLHSRSLRWVGFSQDGRLLATQAVSGEVRLWDVDTALSVGPPLPGSPGTPPQFVEQSLWTATSHRLYRFDLKPTDATRARPWLQEFFTTPE